MANRLTSPAVLAMLLFTSIATPVGAQSSTLTPALLSKLLDLDIQKGSDQDIPAVLANALGLSDTDQNVPMRQVATPDVENPSTVLHGFAVPRGNDQDVVISVRRKGVSIHAFRLQRNGTLVRAAVYDFQTRQVTQRNPTEAQKELDSEFGYWARAFADDK
jgi:hypothetical protein